MYFIHILSRRRNMYAVGLKSTIIILKFSSFNASIVFSFKDPFSIINAWSSFSVSFSKSALRGSGAEYRVAEKFTSINGEGKCAGQLAVFIRFQGCNLNCEYCDTKWANEEQAVCERMTYPFFSGTKNFPDT